MPGTSRRTVSSGCVTVRLQVALILVQPVAYLHQLGPPGGLRRSGPFALLDRLAPEVTAVRWSGSVRLLAYSRLRSPLQAHPPER